MSRRIHDEAVLHRLLRSKLLLSVELLFLVLIGVALGKELVQKYTIEREINQLKEEYANLEKQKVDLEQLVTYFQTDSFQEEEARTKLGLIKPGENVIILPQQNGEDRAASSSSTTDESVSLSQSSNPQRWWSFFFRTKNS
ncbi:MAG: septum formation initiator family protein [Patescibacteria group bacterium]|jgi:cell division protein FtsB